MDKRLLTTNEVAELTRNVPSTVRYWRHIGIGPRGFKVGRKVLYEVSEVERWLQECQAVERLEPSQEAS